MSYLNTVWAVDSPNKQLYKYTNDVLEAKYSMPITKSAGNSAICVSTNAKDILITCPNCGQVLMFDAGYESFIRSITLGGTPMGIAEGTPYATSHTPYFVTNYSTNNLMILKNGEVVQTIKVGVGPRGVAVDSYGKVFVANYLGKSISVLTRSGNSYAVTNTITVPERPLGIIVNYNDDIYVSCQSGKLVKIKKTLTTKVFNIDGTPGGIIADKFGNVWVTNYNNNSVLKLSLSEKFSTFPCGGQGPIEISANEKGEIYIFNNGDYSITHLGTNGSLQGKIDCDYLPNGFGDFIGMCSKLAVTDGNAVKPIEPNKIEFDDLSEDLQNIITGSESAGIHVEAKNVSYTGLYDNVDAALDALLFTKPFDNVKSFTVSPLYAEKGSTVRTVTFNHNINTDMIEKLEINNGIGEIGLGTQSTTKTGLSITNTTKFTLTITNIKGFKDSETSATLTFANKIYWGVSTEEITANNILTNLTNTKYVLDSFANKYDRELDFTTGIGNLYIALPTSIGLKNSEIFVNGFNDSNWIKTGNVTFRNASGYSTRYDIFKSGYTHNVDDVNIKVHIKHNV